MYRNLYYDQPNQCVHLFTWDKDGNRVVNQCSYQPYLYVETHQKTDYKSIYKTNLKKKIFPTRKERNNFINKTGITRVFENLKCDQQFLVDMFHKEYHKPEFNQHPLKIWFLDIETYSPDHFPEPEFAPDPINVITIYDSIQKRSITWGTKPLKNPIENNEYVYCTSEVAMLENFLGYMEADYPDILSGWNSEFFDLPYLIRRVTNVLGEQYARKFSPVGHIFSATIRGQFNNEQVKWYISAMSCIDYLNIYKKFSMGDRESYKLDAIAEAEIGESKVDYGDTNLSSLADDDWQTFVEYNIQDVMLLVKMEEKLRYIALLRMLAYTGLTPFEGAIGTIGVITGAVAIKARDRGECMPTFIRDGDRDIDKYIGAYVADPQGGFMKDILSLDANSLYPSIMISLNLSPETKVGVITEKTKDHITIKHVNGNLYTLSHEKFIQFVKQEKISISRAKVLFTQKYKGIVPIIVDEQYDKRLQYKKELKEIRGKLEKIDENHKDYAKLVHAREQANLKQYTIKILINTFYGYFGNKFSPMGDVDIATAITTTGRAVIKESNKILEQYIKDKTGKDKLDKNPIIYNDTDSSYITINEIIDHMGLTLTKDGKIQPEIYDICDDIENNLNAKINQWAKTILNSHDSRFVFKRETICDVGMFLAKKRYVLRVLDDEGFAVNKFKYTGVDVVKTTMPKKIKPYVKNIIQEMLINQDEHKTNEMFCDVYDIFKELPFEDFALIKGIKEYDKYATRCDGFNTVKRMPGHHKAAYFYNLLVQRHGLDAKYEQITSGDKIKYMYLDKPNKYDIDVIGFKGHFPDEFDEILKPDIEKMFEKVIYAAIERFYECAGWKLRKPTEQIAVDLFDLFA